MGRVKTENNFATRCHQLLAMAEKPKTEVHTDNGLPPSAFSGRVSCSSSGDRRVPGFRKSSMLWIWQHDKRTDDYKIMLNLSIKIDENKKKCHFSVKCLLASFHSLYFKQNDIFTEGHI